MGPQLGQLGVKIPSVLPDQDQAAPLHPDTGLLTQELVAYPQGEVAGEGMVFQRILDRKSVV